MINIVPTVSGLSTLFQNQSGSNAPVPEDSVPEPAFGSAYAAPLIESLTGIEIESAWNERIDNWFVASDEEAMSARLFIGTVRDRVVEGLSDTDDAVEFQTAALLAFTRLKAFWFELNNRLGFQIATETLDNSVPLRASLVAALLEAIEQHLPERSIEKVDAFLSTVVSDDVVNDLASPNRLLPGPADVRLRITNLLSTIETLSERVVQQEAELIRLRSTQNSLQNEFGPDFSASQVAARIRTLSASVTGFEAQASMEEIYRQVLGQALGTTDPLAVVQEVRALRETAQQLRNELDQSRLEKERIDARFGDTFSPESALDTLREAEWMVKNAETDKSVLQLRLAAQADETAEVIRDRDRLLAMIGASNVESAESMVRTLHENAAAYADIADLLGSMGNELGKING